ncbi:MAG TPA: hypothetical protein VIO58_10595 [Candidatus Methanoperedens sp.]
MRISALLIALFVLAATGISGCLSGAETPPANIQEPRENTDAGVQISLTYLPDITDATAFELKVTAHKDYNDDFKNNAYLRDSAGKTYQALSYEGEGGHHAGGILRFPKIESKRFEIVIKDVAGVNERVFKW